MMGRVRVTINPNNEMDVLRHSICTESARRMLLGGPGLLPIGRNMIGLASRFGYIIVKC